MVEDGSKEIFGKIGKLWLLLWLPLLSLRPQSRRSLLSCSIYLNGSRDVRRLAITERAQVQPWGFDGSSVLPVGERLLLAEDIVTETQYSYIIEQEETHFEDPWPLLDSIVLVTEAGRRSWMLPAQLSCRLIAGV